MKLVQAKNYTPANRTAIDLVVIHDMEYPERAGAAAWCADFFAGPNAPKASAHYCVDAEMIVQCVQEKDVAWHAPGGNAKGIGIEHAGYARQTADEWLDAYSVASLQLSAELTAQICNRYGIPVTRPSVEELKAGARGIVGHIDCTNAFSGGKGHTDPGEGFPWDWYLARVAQHLALLNGPPDVPDSSSWPIVTLDGARYAVAPIYIPFVGIGQAEDLAAKLRCELPTPALVRAIWEQADCKLDAGKLTRSHDGTPKTMASLEMFESQAQLITEQVGARSLGVDFTLQAGTFKDVVKDDGVLGIYGWQHLDGTPIQPFYSKHARGWLDYSQGLRLVRHAA